MRTETVFGALLLALTLFSGPWAQKAPEKEEAVTQKELQPGDVAPDFTLPSTQGGTVRLSSLRGKVVVLYFYPKDDTPGCTKEACSFRDGRDAIAALGAVVLGVSKDSLGSHDQFTRKYGLNFPLLSDPEGAVLESYGCWKKGSIFGKTALGVNRSTFLIDGDGVIRQIWRSVDVKGHDQAVLEAVKKLVGTR